MRVIRYSERTCTNCGCIYIPRSSTQKWCDTCLRKTCEYCGKSFHFGKKTKAEKARFCSVECRISWMKREMVGEKAANYRNGNRCKKIKVNCSVCGKEIMREKGQAESWNVHFCSDECRGIYQSKHRRGKNNPRYNRVKVICEWCEKEFETVPSVRNKVRFCSMKCRNNWQSEMMKGANHYNWKGGTSAERSRISVSREYKEWRLKVFRRDNFTCQHCGDNRGGNLNAHHIKSFKDYPELRFDVKNGITLCESCHIKVHTEVGYTVRTARITQ